jgi:hypothetical protein
MNIHLSFVTMKADMRADLLKFVTQVYFVCRMLTRLVGSVVSFTDNTIVDTQVQRFLLLML